LRTNTSRPYLFSRFDFLLPSFLGSFFLRVLYALLLPLVEAGEVFMAGVVVERDLFNVGCRFSLLTWRGKQALFGAWFRKHGSKRVVNCCIYVPLL
jgi:hypothetical protein